ncbi:MAG: hypothetical protein JXR13_19875, partial [Thalassovita sp.]
NIMEVVKRLVAFGILPDKPWHLSWADLTEATMTVKIERASKMASINDTSSKHGEVIFTGDEIREVVDKKPLSDADKYRDDFTGDQPGEGADI